MSEHVIDTGSDAFSIVVNHYGNARGTKEEFEKSDPDLLDPLINANIAAYHLASDALTPGLNAIRAALEACWTGSSAENALSIVDDLTTNSTTIGTNTLACHDSFVQFQSTWRACKSSASSLYEGVGGSGVGEDNSGARRVYLQFNNAMQTSMHAMPSQLVYSEPLNSGQHDSGAGGVGSPRPGGAGAGDPGTGGTNGSGMPSGTHHTERFAPPAFGTIGGGSPHGTTHEGLPPGQTLPGVYHGGNGGYGTGSGTGSGLNTGATLAGYPGGAMTTGGAGAMGTGGLGTGTMGTATMGTGTLGTGGLGAGGAGFTGAIVPGGFGGGLGGNAALAGAEQTETAGLTGSGDALELAQEQAGDGVLGAREGIGGVGSDDAAGTGRPMLGGRGAGGSSDDEDERDRTTWLAEDDGIWGEPTVAPPGTIA